MITVPAQTADRGRQGRRRQRFQFGGLVFDTQWDTDFGNEQDTRKIYSEKIDIFPEGSTVFMPVTGFKTRPEVMYRLPQ